MISTEQAKHLGDISVCGHLDSFKRYVKNTPYFDEAYTYINGGSLLHLIVGNNNLKVLPYFLTITKNLNLQVGDMEHTPLHWAVYYQNFQAVKLLLDAGADVTIGDANKRTPLGLAEKLAIESGGSNREYAPIAALISGHMAIKSLENIFS